MVVIHVKVRPSPPNPSEGFLNPFLAHGTGPPRSPSPPNPPPCSPQGPPSAFVCGPPWNPGRHKEAGAVPMSSGDPMVDLEGGENPC